MKTRCLIIDDEPIATRVIRSHLEKVPEAEVVGCCSDALAAFDAIRRQRPDLLFLDVEMPELTGVDLVRALEAPPAVIFTTAHRDYALEGFELDAVDYLLKPVSLPRLLRAFDKYRRQYAADGAAEAPAPPQYLTLRADRRTHQVPHASIRYIESVGDYVKVHTDDAVLMTKQRLSRLADGLAAHGFLRIHRSYLVCLARVTSYAVDRLHVGPDVLPISRSYRRAVRSRLDAQGD